MRRDLDIQFKRIAQLQGAIRPDQTRATLTDLSIETTCARMTPHVKLRARTACPTYDGAARRRPEYRRSDARERGDGSSARRRTASIRAAYRSDSRRQSETRATIRRHVGSRSHEAQQFEALRLCRRTRRDACRQSRALIRYSRLHFELAVARARSARASSCESQQLVVERRCCYSTMVSPTRARAAHREILGAARSTDCPHPHGCVWVVEHGHYNSAGDPLGAMCRSHTAEKYCRRRIRGAVTSSSDQTNCDAQQRQDSSEDRLKRRRHR